MSDPSELRTCCPSPSDPSEEDDEEEEDILAKRCAISYSYSSEPPSDDPPDSAVFILVSHSDVLDCSSGEVVVEEEDQVVLVPLALSDHSDIMSPEVVDRDWLLASSFLPGLVRCLFRELSDAMAVQSGYFRAN
jgi:hypothetical protein